MADKHPPEKTPKRAVILDGVVAAVAVAQPIIKLASSAGIPGLDIALSLVEKIFAVMEKMRFNKKQCRRLAESARDIVDSVEEAIGGATPEEMDSILVDNISKLVRTLQRVEQHMRDLATLGFVKRLLQYAAIQEELVDLDRECQAAAGLFMMRNAIDSRRHQLQSEKARKDDMKSLMEEVKRITEDQDKLAERIGLRGTKIDSDSTNGIQMLLHRIDTEPNSISPEIRDFAETASRTIKSRTNYDVPRTLPWFVKLREIKRGEKIGSGGFSFVYKGYWITREMEVAIKVFRERESINELIDEIVIWRSFNHAFLHPFLGAAPLETPAFVISPYCKNGNALEYLAKFPTAKRLQILHDVSRGMEYLHSNDVIHGDLKARNVLIDDEGRGVVADFGLAKFQRRSGPSFVRSSSVGTPSKTPPLEQPMVNLVGTLHWLAPECFVDGNITKATDMWAMGMTGYEIFTNGRIPLQEIADDALGQSLQDGVRPERSEDPPISDTAWVMMTRCWSHEPLDRPSFAQLSLVLGVFQDSDIDSLQEASMGFADENWIGTELSKWPGLAEQLVGILTLILEIGPVQSNNATSTRFSSLSERAQEQVISALRVLAILAKNAVDDNSVGQIIINAGALPALLFILRERTEINPEIIRLGCEVVELLSAGYTNDTVAAAITDSDFVQVLCQLVGSAEITIKAMATLQKLVVSNRTYAEELEQKKRALEGGVISRLSTVLKSSQTDTILEACEFITLLGRYPTSLSQEDLQELSPGLTELICHEEESLQTSAITTLYRLSEDDSQCKYLRNSNVLAKIIPAWQAVITPPWEDNASQLMLNLAMTRHIDALLTALSLEDTSSFKLSAVNAVASVGARASPQEKQELANTHDVVATLLPLLSTSQEDLADAARRAVAAFSTTEATPFLIHLMEGDDQASKIMALKTFKAMASNGGEDEKTSFSKSGVIPLLGRLLRPLTTLEIAGDMLELRGLIVWTLNEIVTISAGPNLELIVDTCIDAGLHILLIELLRSHLVDPVQEDYWGCVLTLEKMSRGSDAAKNALAEAEIFSILYPIMDFADTSAVGKSSEILEGLLSTEEENKTILSGILSANLISRLVKCASGTEPDPVPAAQALSSLMISQDPEAVEQLKREGALHVMIKLCTDTDFAVSFFGMRMYMIVEYLHNPSPAIQEFGVFLTALLLKGTVSQRKSVINTSGLRGAIEKCVQSENHEIGEAAKEVLVKLGTGRAGRR